MRKAPLGMAAEFIRGITFKPDDLVHLDEPDAVVCMRTKNIQSQLEESDRIAVPRSLIRSEEKFLRAGDILLSSANSWELVGKSVAVPPLSYPATAGGFISIVRAKTGTHHRYLYHWLTQPSVQHAIRHCGRQTTNISNLDVGRFLELELPYPTRAEQERIAAILDKADAIRCKRRHTLHEFDALLRSQFSTMFSEQAAKQRRWPSVPLAEIVERITVGHVGPSAHAIRDMGIPYLRTQNIGDGEVVTEELKFVSPEFAASHQSSALREGDVIISRHVTDEIRSAIIPSELNGANCANVVIIRPGKLLTPSYIHLLLRTPLAQAKLLERQVGSAQQVVNTRSFQSWFVCRPDRVTLLALEGIVLRANEFKRHLRAARLRADQLFAALSQRAFHGEL